MTDPKNHDDELGETTSSGEPEDADVEATDTDEATDSAADDADEMVDDVDEVDELDEEQDEERRKDKPAATGKASRSGNPARAAEAETTPRSTRPKPQKIGNRWAAPAMLASAGIGLLWIGPDQRVGLGDRPDLGAAFSDGGDECRMHGRAR